MSIVNPSSFSIPVLTEGKHWYISYYVEHPITGVRERIRKTYGLNRIRLIKARRRKARKIIKEITTSLYSGWNPLQKVQTDTDTINCIEALNLALKLKISDKRPDTVRSYSSYHRIFTTWLTKHKLHGVSIDKIDRRICQQFVDDLNFKKKVSANTRINYINNLKGFFNSLKFRGYIDKNPWEGLEKIRKSATIRRAFTPTEEKLFVEYLKNNDPDMLFCIRMIHDFLIRVNELCKLQIKDICFTENTLFVSGKICKNGVDTWRTIPANTRKILLERLNNYPLKCYIVGHGLRPNMRPTTTRHIQRRHRLLLEKCELYEKGLGPYSWKDTAVVKLKRAGQSIIDVKDQCGHLDIESTMIYMKEQPKFNERLFNTYPEIGE